MSAINQRWKKLRCAHCREVALWATERIRAGDIAYVAKLRWASGEPCKAGEMPRCPNCGKSLNTHEKLLGAIVNEDMIDVMMPWLP
jgi:NAD-dependent SIR2 family protein deacetylase